MMNAVEYGYMRGNRGEGVEVHRDIHARAG